MYSIYSTHQVNNISICLAWIYSVHIIRKNSAKPGWKEQHTGRTVKKVGAPSSPSPSSSSSSATISETGELGWAFLQTVFLPTLKCRVQSGGKKKKLRRTENQWLNTVKDLNADIKETPLHLKLPTDASTAAISLHLHVGLYPFHAVLFCASSSSVQQHDAQLQMKWNQAHHWVGPALLLQRDLNEVLAHPEITTKDPILVCERFWTYSWYYNLIPTISAKPESLC